MTKVYCDCCKNLIEEEQYKLRIEATGSCKSEMQFLKEFGKPIYDLCKKCLYIITHSILETPNPYKENKQCD